MVSQKVGPTPINAVTMNSSYTLQLDMSAICQERPRFLAGDWNVECGSLPVFAVLEPAGFVDLQDIALARWGYEVKPTCKTYHTQGFLLHFPENSRPFCFLCTWNLTFSQITQFFLASFTPWLVCRSASSGPALRISLGLSIGMLLARFGMNTVGIL